MQSRVEYQLSQINKQMNPLPSLLRGVWRLFVIMSVVLIPFILIASLAGLAKW